MNTTKDLSMSSIYVASIVAKLIQLVKFASYKAVAKSVDML